MENTELIKHEASTSLESSRASTTHTSPDSNLTGGKKYCKTNKLIVKIKIQRAKKIDFIFMCIFLSSSKKTERAREKK